MDEVMYELSTQRHSLAHVLAQAIQREIDMHVQLGIGPAIDEGFYYDIVFPQTREFSDEQLKVVEKQMEKIIKENQPFFLLQTTTDQSEAILKLTEQTYKLQMRQEFLDAGKDITFYINTVPLAAKDKMLQGIDAEYLREYGIITDYIHTHYPEHQDKFVTFIDMCAGPHVASTKYLAAKAFKLDKIAGAYWKGDEKNIMMTRVYGLAFANKEELKAHLDMLEEAKRRDHRVLGKQLQLFTFSERVGAGLPLFLPNGEIIKYELEQYMRQEKTKLGYSFVTIPHIAKRALYEKS
ncbi:MAG: hypothetical protein H6765_01325 [Candidatus Peribacteria bacterium]|nr:MAG: hypothetical protein H6765_01325 [Candidatus Peribacteria bacterium]